MSFIADLDIGSHSPEQTRRLGSHLGRLLQPGDLVLLEGDFGSGKTTFAQGIAKGLGFDARYVNSPTFTLVNEYKSSFTRLYHIDLYRLENVEQVSTLGLEDYLDGSGVTVIEWPQGAADWLDDDRLLVRLGYLNDTKRSLRLYATGARYRALIDRFSKVAYGL